MPASAWSQLVTSELEFSILAETALTGVAMTTLTPGLDVEPVTLALNYYRPARAQPGNLLARAMRTSMGRNERRPREDPDPCPTADPSNGQ